MYRLLVAALLGLTAACAAPHPLDVPTDPAPAAVTDVDLDAARRAGLAWVAATGELLALGPIARHARLATLVTVDATPTVAAAVDSTLDQLSAQLTVPPSEVRLLEVPLTATVEPDGAGGRVVSVWSVVTAGAQTLGAPRVLWRTTRLHLTPTPDGWRVAGAESTPGPTPLASDDLPAGFDEWAVVTAWPPATPPTSEGSGA